MTLEQCTVAVPRTFDALVHEHKQRIYAYITRLTGDGVDADDLTQEVFVRAFQSFNAFRHEAAVDTWLYRIATNLVIDRFRRARRAPQILPVTEQDGDPVGELACPSREADPALTAQLAELQAEVRRAISTLPTKLRAAIVLHDMEGLSYEDVAVALGCPVGTVKSRLFNARSILRRRLSGYVEG